MSHGQGIIWQMIHAILDPQRRWLQQDYSHQFRSQWAGVRGLVVVVVVVVVVGDVVCGATDPNIVPDIRLRESLRCQGDSGHGVDRAREDKRLQRKGIIMGQHKKRNKTLHNI